MKFTNLESRHPLERNRDCQGLKTRLTGFHLIRCVSWELFERQFLIFVWQIHNGGFIVLLANHIITAVHYTGAENLRRRATEIILESVERSSAASTSLSELMKNKKLVCILQQRKDPASCFWRERNGQGCPPTPHYASLGPIIAELDNRIIHTANVARRIVPEGCFKIVSISGDGKVDRIHFRCRSDAVLNNWARYVISSCGWLKFAKVLARRKVIICQNMLMI